MAIFSSGKYSTLSTGRRNKMVIPDGTWIKCKKCAQTLYINRLEDNLQVCWCCGCHLPMSPAARINMPPSAASRRAISSSGPGITRPDPGALPADCPGIWPSSAPTICRSCRAIPNTITSPWWKRPVPRERPFPGSSMHAAPRISFWRMPGPPPNGSGPSPIWSMSITKAPASTAGRSGINGSSIICAGSSSADNVQQ